MKKWGVTFFFILSLLVTAKWLTQYHRYELGDKASELKNKEWQGYIKKPEQKTAQKIQVISQEDKKFLPSEKIRRGPSSTSAPQKMTPPKKKKIIGNKQVLTQELMLINEPREDWQEVFVQKMLDIQNPNTKMFVQHKGQALIVKNAQARSVEEVMVTFKSKEQGVSSYMAWVDSETGSLVNTWSRTHNHNFRKQAPRLTPTGQL